MPSSLLSVPLLGQSSRSDCLPTCVEMVLGHFGRRIDAAWLRRILESTPIGTPGFKVRNLERHGYFVTYAPATDERVLMDALHRGIPPIVLLLTTNLSYWDTETAHAVVVVGMDDDMVILNDPEFPQEIQHVPIGEFIKISGIPLPLGMGRDRRSPYWAICDSVPACVGEENPVLVRERGFVRPPVIFPRRLLPGEGNERRVCGRQTPKASR